MSARPGSAAILLAAGLTGPDPAQPPAAPARAPVPAPPVCTAPEHRQLDFWVGRWDVYRTGTDTRVACSLIERLHGGCVIREQWMPLDGAGGHILSNWVPAEGRWRQIWTDGRNSWRDHAGAMEDGAMVLTASTTGSDGAATLNRICFTREAGGTVRQQGATSADGGRTWADQYDFTYRPAEQGRA